MLKVIYETLGRIPPTARPAWRSCSTSPTSNTWSRSWPGSGRFPACTKCKDYRKYRRSSHGGLPQRARRNASVEANLECRERLPFFPFPAPRPTSKPSRGQFLQRYIPISAAFVAWFRAWSAFLCVYWGPRSLTFSAFICVNQSVAEGSCAKLFLRKTLLKRSGLIRRPPRQTDLYSHPGRSLLILLRNKSLPAI